MLLMFAKKPPLLANAETINHNLLGMPKERGKWIQQMFLFAANAFVKGYSIKEISSSLSTEVTKGLIVCDIAQKNLMNGYLSVNVFDPRCGRFEVLASSFSGSKGYLFTKDGFFKSEDNIPITDSEQKATCCAIRDIIAFRHPALGAKLYGHSIL